MLHPLAACRVLLPLGAALALAACGGNEEPTYETDVTDASGGEFIVNQEDPNAVPVDTPDTPMTPVPDETAAGDDAAATDVPAE